MKDILNYVLLDCLKDADEMIDFAQDVMDKDPKLSERLLEEVETRIKSYDDFKLFDDRDDDNVLEYWCERLDKKRERIKRKLRMM